MEIKAQSKVGSLDNVKYKPGGGEVKIFDDKSYIKQNVGQMGTPTKSQVNYIAMYSIGIYYDDLNLNVDMHTYYFTILQRQKLF